MKLEEADYIGTMLTAIVNGELVTFDPTKSGIVETDGGQVFKINGDVITCTKGRDIVVDKAVIKFEDDEKGRE